MTPLFLLLSVSGLWSFDQEFVNVRMERHCIEVTGTYTLHCAPGAPDLPILFPFPTEVSAGRPGRYAAPPRSR